MFVNKKVPIGNNMFLNIKVSWPHFCHEVMIVILQGDEKKASEIIRSCDFMLIPLFNRERLVRMLPNSFLGSIMSFELLKDMKFDPIFLN